MKPLTMITLPTLDGQPIIARETEKAMLLEVSDGQTTWMPKSQITGFFSTATGVWLVTSPWMAREKGLSYRARPTTESELYEAQANGTGGWLDLDPDGSKAEEAYQAKRAALEYTFDR